MRQFFGKLNFIHRQLWHQDLYYRGSLLLGPAALVGVLLASLLWWGRTELAKGNATVAGPQTPPNWASPRGKDQYWDKSDDALATVKPTAPLPPIGALTGALIGLTPGWEMYSGQLEVNGVDANLLPTRLTTFSLVGSTFDMASILAAGPKDGPLYIGVGTAFLAIKTPGIYGLSARLARPAGQRANCLTRLVLGGRRVVSNLDIDLRDDVLKTFDPVRFDLQPGLYRIGLAFGCWHNQEATGPGAVTLMIAYPGEQNLVPARADDIVRLEQPGSQPHQ